MDGFSLTKQSEVFKVNYDKKSENKYNSANVLNGRIIKKFDFTGSEKSILNPLSFAGGVGSGRLPKSSSAKYKQSRIKSKKVYATCEIEREAIHASANDKGAFLRATQETVKKTVESYMRNDSRILFSDGTGVLGFGTALAGAANVSGAGSEANPYIVEIPASCWKDSNWEEEDYVQMVTGFIPSTVGGDASGSPEGVDTETNLLLVQEVFVETRKVALVGTSTRLAALTGVGPLADTDAICMQRSFNKDPMGLSGVVNFSQNGTSANSLYEIPAQRRWKMKVTEAAGRGITPDMLNEMMLGIERQVGEAPKMIMTSYAQYQNILALLEEQKVYTLGNRNLQKGKELVGKWGFNGVEFMSTRGAIGVFVDRFCEDDRVYFLNDDMICRHHRPGHGWFTEDKTVFLRLQDEDAYSARYGGYYNNYIVPTGQGCLKGLAI